MMSHANSSGRSHLAVLLVAASLVTLGVVAGAYSYARWKESIPQDNVLEAYRLNRPIKNRLASEYQDTDGDLVADAPAEASQWLNPDTVKFSYLAARQDHYADVWASFVGYLSEQIERPVEFQPYSSPEDQLLAIKSGDAHIVGLNSGSVPIAVNSCGFVPLCSFGSEDGPVTYTMQVIVPADSPIADMKHVAGHMLTLTDTTSNSGWKAPLLVLWRDFQLQPVRDFDVVYSGGHGESIRGIADGTYEVAAVASDEVALAIKATEVSEQDFRVIYESEPFCNNTFGVPYNLDPKMVKAIRTAFLEYPWEDSQLKEEFVTIGASRFQPINYKKHFKLMGEIDEAMGRRHDISGPSAKPKRPNT